LGHSLEVPEPILCLGEVQAGRHRSQQLARLGQLSHDNKAGGGGGKPKKGAFPPTMTDDGDWNLVSESHNPEDKVKTQSSEMASAYLEGMKTLACALKSNGPDALYDSAIFLAKCGEISCNLSMTGLSPTEASGHGNATKTFKDLVLQLRSTDEGKSLFMCSDEVKSDLTDGNKRMRFVVGSDNVFMIKLFKEELDKQSIFDFVKSYMQHAKQTGNAPGKILFELTYENNWFQNDMGNDAFEI
jgi:hypothetical protein